MKYINKRIANKSSMIKKYYWAIAVAAAFVAGTMTTGGVVYASFDQCSNDPPQGVSDGRPFLEIWQAICDLETQVGNDNDTDPTNELQTISDSGGVTLSDGGGTVSCADITGDAGLCDGTDDVSILGFYKVRDQQTVTAEQAVNGGTSQASCDDNDFPVFVGFFGPQGLRLQGMDVSENAGGAGVVFLKDLTEGTAFGVGVICADFDPLHNNAD